MQFLGRLRARHEESETEEKVDNGIYFGDIMVEMVQHDCAVQEWCPSSLLHSLSAFAVCSATNCTSCSSQSVILRQLYSQYNENYEEAQQTYKELFQTKEFQEFASVLA